ncbi:MAG: cadherin-like domain-containing protein [Gammaproteobacteria bacterium]|nr:cadherin-like domain-containing protein [Gammaproteobacteria bacterium]
MSPVVTITHAGADDATVNTMLNSLVFNNTSNNDPSTTARTVTLTSVTDSGSGLTADGTVATINIIPMSDGVTVTANLTDSTLEDTDLVFSIANGNEITVDDGTAGDPILRTTLTVSNGTLTLATTAGLTSVTGDGTGTIVVIGAESDINNALDGLTFSPTGDYNGPAALTVTTDLQADLLGFYEFEVNGDVGNDTSPNGTNDGTVSGATQIIDGTRGNVLQLDGNDFISIPGRFGEPQSMTLAAWVQLDAAGGESEVINLGDRVILRLDMNFSALGVFGSFYDGSNYLTTSSGTFIAGTGWHHVAYTIDGTTNEQTLYIDGIAVDTTNHAVPVNWSGGVANSAVGSHANTSSYFFDGEMDDARIYDRALSAGEIQSIAIDQFSASATVSITVDPVDDPININTSGNTVTFTEDAGATTALFAAGIDTIEAGDTISQVILTLANVEAGDTLQFGATSIDLNTNGATGPDGTGFTYTVSSAGASPVVTITHAGADDATVNTMLNSLVFNNTSNDDPGTTARTVTLTSVTDSGSGLTLDGTVATVNITPVDDPININTTGNAVTFTEDAGATTALFSAGIDTIETVDTISQVVLTLANVEAGDTLLFGATSIDLNTNGATGPDGAGFTYTVSSAGASPVVTITHAGADDATVNTMLNSLVFNNTSNDNPGTTARTVTLTSVTDSGSGLTLDGTMATINVSPANDAPTATNTSQGWLYTEGFAVDLIDIVVTDPDNGDTITATLTLADTSTGSLSANDGASYDGVSGIWTISDSVANVNTALANLVFTPNTNNDINTSLNVHIEDAAGAGPADTTIALDVTPVDDPPTATNLNQSLAYNQGDAVVAINDIVVTEVDTGDSITATLTLLDTSTGTLSANDGATYDGLTGIWTITDSVANVNTALANLVFNPDAANIVDTSITTHIEDAAGTGPADGSIILDVTPGNVAPTTTPVVLAPIAEDSGVRLITQAELLVNANDVNGDTLTAAGLAISSGGGSLVDNGDGTWNYTPALNDDSNLSFTYTISDGIAAPIAATASLDITPVNDDPTTASVVLTPIAEDSGVRVITQAELLANANDVDGDTLTAAGLSISSGNGSLVDNGDGTWNYTPALNDDSAVSFSYSISDGVAAPIAASASLDITPVDDAPTLVNAIPNQTATEDLAFNFSFAANTFSDVDVGDSLSYSASLAGGGSLPSWLNFDDATRTFSGTPTNSDVGTITVEVTADDGNGGAVASETFDIQVANTNDAPSANNLGDTVNYVAGTDVVPLNDILIQDVDSAEVVTASLTLLDPALGELSANDGASYDPATGTWSITGSVANVNTALANLSFIPASDDDLETGIAVSIDDGDEDGSGPLLGSLRIAAIPLPEVELPTVEDVTEDEEPVIVINDEPATEPEAEAEESLAEEELTDDPIEQANSTTAEPVIPTRQAQASDLPPIPPLELVEAEQSEFNQPVNSTDFDEEVSSEQNNMVEAAIIQLKEQLTNINEPFKLLDTTNFIMQLDDMREELIENQSQTEKVIGSSLSVSAGLSVGYVVWLARSGVIMSSVLSSLPAWRLIDPLPVLASLSASGLDDDDESLESMVMESNEATEFESDQKDSA